jgi:hypothetical protein
VRSSRNTWDGGSWTVALFRSTDPAVAQGKRRPDGTLPQGDYLVTGNGVGASMVER